MTHYRKRYLRSACTCVWSTNITVYIHDIQHCIPSVHVNSFVIFVFDGVRTIVTLICSVLIQTTWEENTRYVSGSLCPLLLILSYIATPNNKIAFESNLTRRGCYWMLEWNLYKRKERKKKKKKKETQNQYHALRCQRLKATLWWYLSEFINTCTSNSSP